MRQHPRTALKVYGRASCGTSLAQLPVHVFYYSYSVEEARFAPRLPYLHTCESVGPSNLSDQPTTQKENGKIKKNSARPSKIHRCAGGGGISSTSRQWLFFPKTTKRRPQSINHQQTAVALASRTQYNPPPLFTSRCSMNSHSVHTRKTHQNRILFFFLYRNDNAFIPRNTTGAPQNHFGYIGFHHYFDLSTSATCYSTWKRCCYYNAEWAIALAVLLMHFMWKPVSQNQCPTILSMP